MFEDAQVTHTDALEPVARARFAGARLALVAAVAVVGLALVLAGVLVLLDRSYMASGRIGRNVTIQGVAVAGMTAEQARQAAESALASTLPAQLTITYPSGTADPPEKWTTTPQALGLSLAVDEAVDAALRVGREGTLWNRLRTRLSLLRKGVDLPVRRVINQDTLSARLAELAEVVNRAPVDADIEVRGERVIVVPGKVGRTLDVEATAARLTEQLQDPSTNVVEAVVKMRQPNVTAEDLAHLEVVLGQYSTKFRPYQRDRTHNLRLAAAALNETVIKPGEVMSLNERVGERLEERGYRPAPIFIEGEVTPSTGGGVCQIASTTYNAALLANLDIVERHHHSRPVDYVPTGRDATVYWGQYDLKIRNNLSHAVLLITSVGENTVTMKFLGAAEDDYDVEITRSGLTRIPYSTQEVPDPELDEGKRVVEKEGRPGWRVTVSRKVTRNGKLVREQTLHTDYYPPQNAVVRVGTKKKPAPPPTPTPALPGARPTPSPPTTPPTGAASRRPNGGAQ